MVGYFLKISPGHVRGREVWVSPDGLLACAMSIFYVDMGGAVIEETFAWLDEQVSSPTGAPPLDTLWEGLNARGGNDLINFRLLLLDARSGRPEVRANGNEPLIAFSKEGGRYRSDFVAVCDETDRRRYLVFCGGVSMTALLAMGEGMLTMEGVEPLRKLVVEATGSTDWAGIVFPPSVRR